MSNSHTGETAPSLLNNVIVVVCSELIALPFCFSGADAAMNSDWWRAAKGFGIGLPIGIAGLTFPFWRKYLKRPTQEWVQNDAKRWWPLALLLAFIYVIGPNIYRRATMVPPHQVSAVSVTDIEKATAPIKADLEASQRQIASLQSQLAIAIRERDTAQQSASSKLKTPLDTVPNFALTYTLRDDQIKNLAELFFEIKDQMPSGTIIQAFGSDNISYGMGQQLAQVFGRANLNPGIEQVAPLSPKEVGITIRVGDAQSIPEGAKKTAQIFKNVLGVDVPFMSVKSLNGNTFRIFTGPRP